MQPSCAARSRSRVPPWSSFPRSLLVQVGTLPSLAWRVRPVCFSFLRGLLGAEYGRRRSAVRRRNLDRLEAARVRHQRGPPASRVPPYQRKPELPRSLVVADRTLDLDASDAAQAVARHAAPREALEGVRRIHDCRPQRRVLLLLGEKLKGDRS